MSEAQRLLGEVANRLDWDAETQVDMICTYADLQHEFWNTPSIPGSKPATFAEFLADVEAAFIEAGKDEGPPPVVEVDLVESTVQQKPERANQTANAQAEAGTTFEKKISADDLIRTANLLSAVFGPENPLTWEEGTDLYVLRAEFRTPAGQSLQFAVRLRAGVPNCFVQTDITLAGRLIKRMPPRQGTILGQYVHVHEGVTYTLTVCSAV